MNRNTSVTIIELNFLYLFLRLIYILAVAQLDLVFFSARVVNLWNSSPADRISFTSLSAFKNSLKTVDLQSLTL